MCRIGLKRVISSADNPSFSFSRPALMGSRSKRPLTGSVPERRMMGEMTACGMAA
jgi:hypothetical protein